MRKTMTSQPHLSHAVDSQEVLSQPVGLALATQVQEKSGTNLLRCLQCWSCGNGCPFVASMDYTPNQVLRLLQFGRLQEVLSCQTIWLCVGCHTCSSQCPMNIDIAAVMDTLRLMALEKGIAVGKPNIRDFHGEVLKSLEKYGRAHKLSIMLGYKLRTGDWLSDWDLGLKMLAHRKLELRPSRVKAVEEIADLLKRYRRTQT